MRRRRREFQLVDAEFRGGGDARVRFDHDAHRNGDREADSHRDAQAHRDAYSNTLPSSTAGFADPVD
jgi:hypothetical protein